jgi:hypothetical protein
MLSAVAGGVPYISPGKLAGVQHFRSVRQPTTKAEKHVRSIGLLGAALHSGASNMIISKKLELTIGSENGKFHANY